MNNLATFIEALTRFPGFKEDLHDLNGDCALLDATIVRDTLQKGLPKGVYSYCSFNGRDNSVLYSARLAYSSKHVALIRVEDPGHPMYEAGFFLVVDIV
ncbi:MAG: hypothetical protein ACF8MF_06735 [Phycisphaerales bacterium JB052]